MTGFDLAVVGSGFGGSLLAMIARQLGHSVILLEKHSHPRVVVGESSTPLANLMLEELATCYNLPVVRNFAKWGSWQREHPEVACGLKRGFSFFHHDLSKPSPALKDRSRQLLVTASPHDEIGDTHWYRADFDAFLVQEAQRLGVQYFDRVALDGAEFTPTSVFLHGKRAASDFQIRAGMVVDATGPRGFLHQALQLGEASLHDFPETEAIYNHFAGVSRLEQIPSGEPPYPVEDAAVHHVFDGGWIWVLRFNNGVTSAGVAARADVAAKFGFKNNSERAWKSLIEHVPEVAAQFSDAKPVNAFRHIPKVPFRSAQICGDRWALLPSAAGFVDPLLSTGFPLTLLGVKRLARVLETGKIEEYAQNTEQDLLAAATLIGALYANMHRFSLFARLSLLYFAAVSYAESATRLGVGHLASSYLLRDHPDFGLKSRDLLRRATRVLSDEEAEAMCTEILDLIEPFDVAGLCRNSSSNWFPVDAEDLFRSAHKLHVSEEQISAMLARSGFYARV